MFVLFFIVCIVSIVCISMINLFLTSTRLFLIVSKYLVEAFYEGRKVSSRELADVYDINNRTLVPMLNRLTRTGYLLSQVGGSNPGHIFSRNPKDISVGEVIVALEGGLEMAGCDAILGNVSAGCTAENRCTFCKTVAKFVEYGRQEMCSMSLYDLYSDAKKITN